MPTVEQALTELQQAVKQDPNNPQNLLGLSEALAQRGDFAAAVDALDRAAKLPLTEALGAEIRAKRELYVRTKPD